MHAENIRLMYQGIKDGKVFDAIVIVSSTPSQSQFWEQRLEDCRGEIIGEKTRVFSFLEDWPGGAGQLLGTLYAWKKAEELRQILREGGSVAMYHTAGMGTRMSPLPLAEGANKSAVKLPRMIKVKGKLKPITLLEGVIFQTGIFAESRKERLCVFWGDQIFIPSQGVDFNGTHHGEIFDLRSTIPTEEKHWKKDWQSYGLIVPQKEGVLQREKQGWDDLKKLLQKGIITKESPGKVELGKSLGSFSLSLPLLEALLGEYQVELSRKKGKLDTDPHLWMPLTSTKDEFISLGGDFFLWERVNRFKNIFLKEHPELGLLGDKDLGKETFWWDYGQLKLYHQNILKLGEDSFEARCLRKFYGIKESQVDGERKDGLVVKNSILLDCQVKGNIENSFLMGVRGEAFDIKETIVIDSLIPRLNSIGGLVYNLIELEGLSLKDDEVIADCFLRQKGRVRMKTALNRDGKLDWKERVGKSPYSGQELHRILQTREIAEILAEKKCWESYYQRREKIIPQIKKMFIINPIPDNLVETVWGGKRLEILKGLPPSGRKIGESWECSAHPLHPSQVRLKEGATIPLAHILLINGEKILGKDYQKCRGIPPFFLKFLETKDNLSVQVHPGDKEAIELGEENRGKEEAWIILEAEKGAKIYLGFKLDVDRDIFKEDLLSPNNNIADKYLNDILVKPGDLFYLPAGTVHALGKGVVLAEIQQTSDITYRLWDWNRSPKRKLDVKKAISVLNFHKTKKEDFLQFPRNNGERVILMETPYFQVDKLDLRAKEKSRQETKELFNILACLKGEVLIEAQGAKENLRPLQSLLVSAELNEYFISAKTESTILKSFRSL